MLDQVVDLAPHWGYSRRLDSFVDDAYSNEELLGERVDGWVHAQFQLFMNHPCATGHVEKVSSRFPFDA